jgi:hypothetical protein
LDRLKSLDWPNPVDWMNLLNSEFAELFKSAELAELTQPLAALAPSSHLKPSCSWVHFLIGPASEPPHTRENSPLSPHPPFLQRMSINILPRSVDWWAVKSSSTQPILGATWGTVTEVLAVL